MKKSRLFLLIFMLLSLSVVLSGPAAAQDIDVDSMTNKELLSLVEAIMQKLDQDNAAETEEPAAAETPVPTAMPEERTFSVYDNKKLIIGHMPESWFYLNEPGEEEDDGGSNRGYDGGHHNYGGYDFPIYGSSFLPPDLWTLW